MASWKKHLPLSWKVHACYLLNRLGRIREIIKYANVRPDANVHFHIVSCERNAGADATKCLDSVYRQQYDPERITHVFIDDASTDNTPELIESWLPEHPDNRVRYIRQTDRKGGCANNLAGFHLAPKHSIVMEVNGDDWLADPGVLSFIDKVYASPDIWMTYNSKQYATGEWWSSSRPYAKSVVKENAFREVRWRCGQPQTFRAPLLEHLREDSLIDPETGEYWANADDMAFYWSLLELCGAHARHLHRLGYIYNVREYSEVNADPGGQQRRAARICQIPKHSPLEKL